MDKAEVILSALTERARQRVHQRSRAAAISAIVFYLLHGTYTPNY